MKFKTVAEAFNYYRTQTVEAMEQRAQAINTEIDTNVNADIEALNIELRGIKEAKENIELRSQAGAQGMTVIGSMTAQPEVRSFEGADVYETAEYRSAFFKSMLGQEMTKEEKAAFDAGMKEAEKRADVFNSATDNAAVIPTSTLNEIVSKARKMGGLMAECRSFSMPTKIAIPVGTPGNKASWHKEGAEVAGEKLTTASVVFDGYEIIKIFSISAKARRMSITAFEAYLTDELTACVMECIADALVNGTGSEQGTGLISGISWTASNSITVESSKEVKYADVVKAVSLLARGYAKGAKWVMNNATLYNIFYGMVDTNGRPLFIADPKAESIGKILGFEVVIDDYMPADTAVLGNYNYLAYNLPEGIIIEASRESSFKKGLIDYRALAIADCKPIVKEGFVKLSKAQA